MTLAYLLGAVSVIETGKGSGPFVPPDKGKIAVDGRKGLAWWREEDALPPARPGLCGPFHWPAAEAAEALRRLLVTPAVAIAHRTPPEAAELALGERWRREAKAHRLSLLLAVESRGGQRVLGRADLVLVEHARAFGRSLLAGAEVAWARTLEEAAALLLRTRETMAFPEAGLPRTAVIHGDRGRRLDRAPLLALGAAYGVRVSFLPEPGSDFRSLVHGWAKGPPPHGLLHWLPGGDSAKALVKAVQPHWRTLVSELREQEPDDLLVELGWRLAEIIGHDEELRPVLDQAVGGATWADLEARLTEIHLAHDPADPGVAFHVDGDAIKCCRKHGHGYPDPARMLEHVMLLKEAAERWHALGGKIDCALHVWLRLNFGLEIALSDGNQVPKEYHFGGPGNDLPHVKVDDHKHGEAQAGRIHFVLDKVHARILLTYLGGHR